MSYYLFKVTPPRPTFATDMTPAEAATIADHVAYWTGLLHRGTAVAFGPVTDPAGLYGMAVVEAEAERDVRVLSTHDPAITTGLFTYDVFPMPQAIARPHHTSPSAEAAT